MSAELIAKLDAVEKMIDTFTTKSKEEIKQVGDMSQETKTALDNLTTQFGEVQKELAEQATALEEEQKKSQRFLAQGEKTKSFREHLHEKLGAESVKQMLSVKAGDIELKTTMLPASPFIGTGVIQPQRLDGIVYTPPNDRVRPHLTVLPASSDRVSWVREVAFNNRANTVTPGNDKSESDLELSVLDVPIQAIAHTFRMHKNILADISMFASYVAQRGVDGLQDKEDEQVLYGDGVSPNLVGILTDALSAFNPASMYAALVSDGSRGAGYYDILRFAILQVRNAKLRPTAIFLNPADKAAIDIAQISTGSYRRQPDGTVLVNNIWGVPVVEIDAMNPGEFAVGAFRQATTVFDREAVTVKWFEQDRDNVVKNLVTVRIEERIAVATQRPEGIVTGKFDDYMGKYSS